MQQKIYGDVNNPGMATNTPQDDWHKTGLRLPRDLHEQLHKAASESGRSYNGEIVARLQASLAAEAMAAINALGVMRPAPGRAAMGGRAPRRLRLFPVQDDSHELVDPEAAEAFMEKLEQSLIASRRRLRGELVAARSEMSTLLADLSTDDHCDATTKDYRRQRYAQLGSKVRELELGLFAVEDQLEGWAPAELADGDEDDLKSPPQDTGRSTSRRAK